MKETLRHQEAFNYYYSLGDTRNIPQVVQNQKVSIASIKRWSQAFKWQERIAKRDKKIATKLAEKTDKIILKTKAEYRKEIQDSLQLLCGTLALLAEKVKSKSIKADSAKDLATLLKAQELLIRCEQFLSGEVDSRQELVITLQYVDPVPRAKGDPWDSEPPPNQRNPTDV